MSPYDDPNYGDDLPATCEACGGSEYSFYRWNGKMMCPCGALVNQVDRETGWLD